MTHKNRLFVAVACLSALAAILVAFMGLPAAAAPNAPRATEGTFLSATTVDIKANDLLYDAARDVVYASIPSDGGANGNSIAPISRTGQVGEAIFVGSEPNVMALSDDGRYLYVGIDGAGAFRGVDLEDGTVGPLWPLGSDFCGLYVVGDMVGLLEEPDAVAIARGGGCGGGVAVYDDGVMRPETTQLFSGINVIEPSAGPGTLYGYTNEHTGFDFHVLATSADGITQTLTVPGLITGFSTDIHYADGLVYATDGRVVDPETLSLAGTYAAQGPMAVDTSAGIVYFAAGNIFDGQIELKAFDLDTFLPVYDAALPLLDGAFVVELIAFDPDEFAVRLSDGRVLLLALTEGSAVSGRVTTGEFGYGLEGVTLSDGAGRSATTDFNGNYTLAPLPAGSYTLTPTLDGYTFHPPSVEITVPPDAAGQDFVAAPPQTVWGMCLPVVR